MVKEKRKIAIVTTIKNRILVDNNPKYMDRGEIALCNRDEAILANLGGAQDNNPYFRSNKEITSVPHHMFRVFLESLSHWIENFKIVERYRRGIEYEFVLCITDWESTDGDVEQVIDDNWNGKYNLSTLSSDIPGQDFNRGMGLNKAAEKEPNADAYFFCDVDDRFEGMGFFEEAMFRMFDQNEVWFPIFVKEMTPRALFYYTEWAGNGQCFIKPEHFEKTGGWPELGSWGLEDSQFLQRCRDAELDVVIKPSLDIIHQYHNNKHRDIK